MALDRHQSSLATFQPHASVKFGPGNSGSGAWPFCTPAGSAQQQDTASFLSWSTGSEDGACCLISGAQNAWISSDGEADLQGLVSKILDEAVSQNGYDERALPASNSIWAPRSVCDELKQGFQSTSKPQHVAAFRPDCASPTTSNEADADVFRQPKEPVLSQQWIFSVPKADQNYSAPRPAKFPPGLPVPSTNNAHQPQMQKGRHDNTTVNEKRGNKIDLDGFLDLSNAFNPQSEATTPYFYSHPKENTYNGVNPVSKDPYDSLDPSQLVTGFQSFVTGERDVSFHGNSWETQSRHDGEVMGEPWKCTSLSVPTHMAPAVRTTKEQMGVQMERNGVMRNEMVNCEGIQSLHGLIPQNMEPFQQPNMFSGSVSLANHCPPKMTTQKKNNFLPFNLNNNPCFSQQEHIQSKIKSQMQKEEKRMPGIHGEHLYTSHASNCSTKGREMDRHNRERFEIMQPQRFGGDRGSAKSAQQLASCVYPVDDPMRHWSMNSSIYHSRPTLFCGNPDPSVSVGNVMSANEFATLKAVVNDPRSQGGDVTFHGLNSAMASAVRDDVPAVQLYLYLEECCHQMKCLEKERKKTEILLTKASQGGKTIANTSTFLPKMPPNPTRIDHLIVGQMKEQANVASVLHRMESLNGFLHINIHTALKKHYLAISVTEARRTEGISIACHRQQAKDSFADYKDTLLMAVALKELAAATRRLRTALWCALQMVLPKPSGSRDQATGTARCPSPYEGGSFTL